MSRDTQVINVNFQTHKLILREKQRGKYLDYWDPENYCLCLSGLVKKNEQRTDDGKLVFSHKLKQQRRDVSALVMGTILSSFGTSTHRCLKWQMLSLYHFLKAKCVKNVLKNTSHLV